MGTWAPSLALEAFWIPPLPKGRALPGWNQLLGAFWQCLWTPWNEGTAAESGRGPDRLCNCCTTNVYTCVTNLILILLYAFVWDPAAVMCSSSVTGLSLSHAGLRQDYKRWTAMCSKSSYLPRLEGTPCKIWLAVCSMLAIDFWRPFLLVLWAALSGRIDHHLLMPACAWPPTSTSRLPPTCLATSSEAAKQAPPLWWHVHYIGHMADWLHAEGDHWSQADPALSLQQMGEAWHSIFRQMPPPYSTCLDVGHCTERTVCLMMKETKGTFMKRSRAAYLLSMHNIIVDHNNKCNVLLVRTADTITVEQGTATFYRLFGCL